MAEGIQLAPMNTMFYCYHCDQEVSLISPSELTCPECFGGFIEEVPQDDYDDESDVDESEFNMFSLLNVENLFRRSLANTADDDESPRQSVQEPEDEADSSEDGPLGEVYNARRFLQELEDTLIQGPNSRISNIGDYLFGDDIDTLSTLLFNEAEILGPAPLPASKIRLLPVITITKEHVDKGIQCTICMEDFEVKDKAKNLPCDHFYHENCITPWLERHATCPNCRKTVDVVETKSKDRRSQSCPRSYSSESLHRLGNNHLRFSENRPSLGTIFSTSLNPFRLL